VITKFKESWQCRDRLQENAIFYDYKYDSNKPLKMVVFSYRYPIVQQKSYIFNSRKAFIIYAYLCDATLIIYSKKILFGISLAAALMVIAVPAYAQTGEVTNSKYLEIIEHRYRQGEFSDTITSMVKNISTEAIPSISIYLLLYDTANQLITVETGYADVTPLPSQDTSPFSINVF
jgi:hypothetical protein